MAVEDCYTNDHKVVPGDSKKKKPWLDGYADFGGDVGRVYDKDVGCYTRKHMRFIDWFDPCKVASAMMWTFSILSKSVEEPDIKNGKWKYFKDF